jgi:[calcium/calmodulin-dependent protein kinase] kinase
VGEVHAKATDIWAMGRLLWPPSKSVPQTFLTPHRTGIILYCMVCGRLPFESVHILELHEKIINDPYVTIHPSRSDITHSQPPRPCFRIFSHRVQLPKELDGPLKHLLARLLTKSPGERITIDEMRVSWGSGGAK